MLSLRSTLLLALLPRAFGLGILFPLYFCGGEGGNCNTTTCPNYSSLLSGIQAHPSVTLHMIVNPFNGPLSTAVINANYTNYPACLPHLKTATPASALLGYVSTNHSHRHCENITADIRTYASWPSSYRPTGIFFDEAPSNAGNVSLYKYYAGFARGMGFSFIVFNPGTKADSGFYDPTAADMVVTYEGPLFPRRT
ncbi:unnamed protein product [Peniophora sp. CBMAI 1063]|nr:unnamed protein product [Peniophora sp. CBMAI 1063]